MDCPRCGHPNPDSARFCNDCGAPMAADAAPAAWDAPGVGALVAERYRLEREIGRGAFGIVYRARAAGEGEAVAIKFLNVFLMAQGDEGLKLRQRFAREWAAGQKLDHALICRMRETGEERGVPYIVMDYVDGETLAQALSRGGALPLETGIAIAIDCLSALGHAHGVGVIHRDVKPSNVMVDGSGRARLMDFGIAKIMETFSGSLMTQTGLLGTPSYMSPEQASGRKVDLRSDLFSVGLVAYELFTGHRAFEGHPAAIINQILTRPIPEAPHLPLAVQEWLRKACAREPDARFQSAGEMRLALSEAARRISELSAQETVAATPEPESEPAVPTAVATVEAAASRGAAKKSVRVVVGVAGTSARASARSLPRSRGRYRRPIAVVVVVLAAAFVAKMSHHRERPPGSNPMRVASAMPLGTPRVGASISEGPDETEPGQDAVDAAELAALKDEMAKAKVAELRSLAAEHDRLNRAAAEAALEGRRAAWLMQRAHGTARPGLAGMEPGVLRYESIAGSGKDAKAVVEGPDGKEYTLRIGDRIGKYEVRAIDDGHLTYEKHVVHEDGIEEKERVDVHVSPSGESDVVALGKSSSGEAPAAPFLSAPPGIEGLAVPAPPPGPHGAPDRCKLAITSRPAGATIEVDGIIRGHTPGVLVLARGSRISLRLHLDGYRDHTEKDLLLSTDTASLAATLEKEP